ncbi:NAD-dependent protein deacetylase sirtuin-2-like isoform X1 [Lytechinus pictus]|uniref:NAD-dependent protein deacetylase sirtuin-2-like isoform X1 n=2 Tax=Lytechinus pictus TaxID=7653 RepID=UPI0030B9BB76
MAEKDVESLRSFLQRFSLGEGSDAQEEKSKPEQLLKELTLQGVADFVKEGKCKKVIVMSGAGISTSAGIPDFRSPGTGLYDNLQKYNLPNPQAIFEIGFFRENPEPFFTLSKELFPGAFFPTPSHFFIRLLHEKGILLRHYTQNIDTLDRIAGVPDEKIMEAHGSYHTGHCLNCNEEYTEELMREKIMADLIPKCAKCDEGGVIKPDVVFFGESLPHLFPRLVSEDFPQCDLLIVMGTSLVVQPFASLVDKVPETTPRLLINMEKTGQVDPMMMMFGFSSGMDFDSDDKYRDVAYIGPCDEGCEKLADLVGWKKDFAALVKEGEAQKQKKQGKSVKKNNDPASSSTAKTPSPSKKSSASPTSEQKPKTSSPSKKSSASPTKDQKPKTSSPSKKSPASPTSDQKPKTASPNKKYPVSPTKDKKSKVSPTKKTPVSPSKDTKPSSKKD